MTAKLCDTCSTVKNEINNQKYQSINLKERLKKRNFDSHVYLSIFDGVQLLYLARFTVFEAIIIT